MLWNLKIGIFIVVLVVAVSISLYGLYSVAKTLSYRIFYEDMVRVTITEMVKPEALRAVK